VVIFSLIVVSAGGAPNNEAVGFRYWNSTPFHENGFKGFLSVMPTCIFAMAGSENVGLVAVSIVAATASRSTYIYRLKLRTQESLSPELLVRSGLDCHSSTY
jgi:amino acid permease